MSRQPQNTWLALLFIGGGLGLALLPMKPSVEASVAGHVSVLLRAIVPAVFVVILGAFLLARARAGVLVIAAVIIGTVVIFHPVSDRIPDAEVPAFEQVYSLAERAARGEPFRQLDGHWYQVKPWIARVGFF